MAQTDRQTDKSTHWKTAVFDEEGKSTQGNWPKLEILPAHVKELHKKKEVCPTTGREHYQIHVVCHRQVRLSAMTDWVKNTKWFMVLGKQHIANSINYISKVETTAPGAVVEVVKGERYYQIHDLLMIVARCFDRFTFTEVDITLTGSRDFYARTQFLWKNACKIAVKKLGLQWITKLSNPVLEKCWNIHYEELLEVAEDDSPFIIEGESLSDLSEYSFLEE